MRKYLVYILILVLFSNCKKEVPKYIDEYTEPYTPTLVELELPWRFPQMPIPADNPFTKEGIELGRHLFYEKSLSGDNTISCGSCHKPSAGYSDSRRFSVGIDNIQGDRQAMPIMNIGWGRKFFWDGRANSLEELVIEPLENPIEMHETWKNALTKLKGIDKYPDMFRRAFPNEKMDSLTAAKAIAQFMRTLISGNSKFDRVVRNEIRLTPQEDRGRFLFLSDSGADCFHCHSLGTIMFTDFSFRNNGLDSVLTDLGLGGVTGSPNDYGEFKVPSLRNWAYTAPYMHDGRFATMDEVIDHYSTGVKANSPNINIDMQLKDAGGARLTPAERADLMAFLLTLNDSSFLTNPDFQDPN